MASRTLVLIRHAKSADGPVDVDRPLAARGARDATAIGAWLNGVGLVPDRVVVSPALRARQTWNAAAAHLADAPEPMLDERIYDNDEDLLLELIRETPEQVSSLVLVGHNPSFGQLAYDLDDGTGDEDARQDLLTGFPTSAIAIYEVSTGWSEVGRRRLRLLAFTAARG
jgi:phosphohistidine phosphatase